jgi:RNA polymerase sigma-70 factor (ECF subfamily)
MMRATRGDKDAFACVVKTHEQRLLYFAYRMLADWDAAADVVQDALVRLWQSRARYSPQGTDAAYLLRLVRNACIDHVRSNRNWNHVCIDDNMPATSPTCESQALSVGLQDALGQALLRIPESQRVVFVLSEYDGMTYQEIAQVVGCPHGTVASRKFAACESLRRELRSWLEGERDE